MVIRLRMNGFGMAPKYALKRVPACLVLLTLMLSLAACGGQPRITVPGEAYQAGTVRDLQTFPQDLTVYAGRADGATPLLPASESVRQADRFRRLLLAAWEVKGSSQDNLNYFKGELSRQGDKRGYAENLQPWDEQRWQDMQRNAAWASFPSLREPAITVRATNLRAAPTERPRFGPPSAAGQGFPFDEFQQTSLPVGFPLMVLHRSADGAWLYVENAFVPGWIPAQDVAFADESFRRAWAARPLLAFVRDNVSLLSGGAFVAEAHIGTALPLAGDDGVSWMVLVPGRSSLGRAELLSARVAKDTAGLMPLALTPDNLAAVGNRLLGQAYGWGGLFEDRDCSAMLRDLFTPFGLWLPRNSAAQAKAGAFSDFSRLSAGAKEAKILRDGVPFLTVLWLRGHIGLYLGEYQGKAVFFHNIWGLRTVEPNGRDGRHILGRAVITSTTPGQELPNRAKESLLDRMQGMGILGRE